jgi:hypothetical protein
LPPILLSIALHKPPGCSTHPHYYCKKFDKISAKKIREKSTREFTGKSCIADTRIARKIDPSSPRHGSEVAAILEAAAPKAGVGGS